LIGLELKNRIGVRWLADFRDPWTTIGYHKDLKLTKASLQKHKNLERQVLTTADHVVVTSSKTKLEFQNKTDKPITVITNGYDTENNETIVLDEKFSIAHIGSLLSKRNPELLWKAIQDLIAENDTFKKHFQLKLVGVVSDDVLNTLQSCNLTNYIDKVGYVSHIESVRIQKKSQVLLLIEVDSEDTKCIIPGKLFEYMASNRPILAIGPKQSDVEVILKETNTGEYFYYADYKNLKSVILKYFNAFLGGNLKTQAIGLQKYSRKALTKKLTEII
jgi:glycosyltransferase involved in cell wall biosynthesis